MDVLFVNAQDALELRKEVNGQLILGTLLLQADFDVDVLRFCQIDGFKGDYEIFIRNMTEKILTFEPKAVSFYSLWPDYHIMLRIAKELKSIRPDIYTVFGGPQASATAQDTMEAMPYVDFICSGEGENTVVPFFTALLRNSNVGLDLIPGLYYRENGQIIHHDLDHPLCDLNTLPHWDDRLYRKHYKDNHENYTSKNYYMPIDAGRGCPFNCTFCYTSSYWHRAYRMKTIKRIIEEIEYLTENFNISSFHFSHDAFTVNKRLISEFCDYLIDKYPSISWKCASRIDCIDHNLIIKMKEAGLTYIELGIESGSARIQQLINKKLDLTKIKPIVQDLHSSNIKVALFFMYGFPEEDVGDLAQTLSLQFDLLEMGVNYTSMALCRFNPTTKITQKHFDNLVLDYNKHSLFRGVYGLPQENLLIENNKCIFPFYYHLNTLVRDNYSYLFAFLAIYQHFPQQMKHIRMLYSYNDLKLCEDFYRYNIHAFKKDATTLFNDVQTNSVEYIAQILKNFKEPWTKQLLAIMQYMQDIHNIKAEKKEITITKVYNFSYWEYKSQIPITSYTNSSTIIQMQIKCNKLTIRILK